MPLSQARSLAACQTLSELRLLAVTVLVIVSEHSNRPDGTVTSSRNSYHDCKFRVNLNLKAPSQCGRGRQEE
eukprot:1771001-Rhodomonas_salina.1